MSSVPREIGLSNGEKLTLWYATTHLTFNRGIESKWHAALRQEYVSQAFYRKGTNGEYYTIMAYQQGHRPSAKAPIWGIYRVEYLPGSLYHQQGKFTLLRGALVKRDALARFADTVKDEQGSPERTF